MQVSDHQYLAPVSTIPPAVFPLSMHQDRLPEMQQQKDLLGVLLSSTSIIYSSHHRYQIPCTIIWNIEYLHQQSDRLHQLYPPAEQLTFYPHQKFAPKLKQSIVGNFFDSSRINIGGIYLQNIKWLPDLYFALKHLDSSLVLTTHWENLNIDRS